MKILTVALNTFREAIRDRILYLLLFFAAIGIAFSRFLALLTVGDRVKIIKDVGLASISLFGILMAFLLGKYLGLVFTLAVMIGLMSFIFLALIFAHTLTIEWKLLIAILFIFIELCVITAVAILFSCFSTPILSSLYSLAFYLIGHLSWGMETLIAKTKPGWGKTLLKIIYTFLPDLENFNFKTEVVHNLPIPGNIYWHSFLYGFFYSLFLLALAMLIFHRRDFV